jgi:hypothetical protein
MYIVEFKEVWREGKKPIAGWPILLSLSLNEKTKVPNNKLF